MKVGAVDDGVVVEVPLVPDAGRIEEGQQPLEIGAVDLVIEIGVVRVPPAAKAV